MRHLNQDIITQAIDCDSHQVAHALLADEPFTRAGAYASTTGHALVNHWPQKDGFVGEAP